MLDIIQRYAPIANAIKKSPPKNKRIVEIGGTGEGIGFYLPGYQIIDCDIEFVKNILPDTKAVKIKNDKLPLGDNYAEIAISIDTLEHLPTNQKKQALIKEILRVAEKKVILAIPTGQESLNTHLKLKKILQKKYPKIKHHYLDEHLKYGHPEKEEILKMIKDSGFKTKVKHKQNTNTHLWLLFHKIYLRIPQLYHILRYRKLCYHLLNPTLPLLDFSPTIRTIFYIEMKK